MTDFIALADRLERYNYQTFFSDEWDEIKIMIDTMHEAAQALRDAHQRIAELRAAGNPLAHDMEAHGPQTPALNKWRKAAGEDGENSND